MALLALGAPADEIISAMAVITQDRAKEQRAREITNALATVRIEGLEPSAEAHAIFQRYVEGELTSGEMGRSIDQLLNREYGPVRLPGH